MSMQSPINPDPKDPERFESGISEATEGPEKPILEIPVAPEPPRARSPKFAPLWEFPAPSVGLVESPQGLRAEVVGGGAYPIPGSPGTKFTSSCGA